MAAVYRPISSPHTAWRAGVFDTMETIILAGGLGSRLKSVIGDTPKAMALVDGRPFLYYLLHYLKKQGISKVLLSLGYQHQIIENAIAGKNFGLELKTNLETTPLGTGGAIRFGMEKLQGPQVLVMNGDSFFDFSLADFFSFHKKKQAACTLALKKMKQFDRYGSVETDETGRIFSFREKEYRETGWINTGVYLIDKARFMQATEPGPFSFETAYLEKQYKSEPIFGFQAEGYFIDIGVPQDYARAQQEWKNRFDL